MIEGRDTCDGSFVHGDEQTHSREDCASKMSCCEGLVWLVAENRRGNVT